MDVDELREVLILLTRRDDIDPIRRREDLNERAGRLRRRKRRIVSVLVTSGAVAVSILTFVLLSGGQDHESIRVSPARTVPPTTTTLGPATPANPALPTVALVSQMGGESDPGLPDGWLRCTNEPAGFSIGAPADWYTSSDGPYQASPGFDGACSFFDPGPFEVLPDVTPQAVQLQFPLGDAFPAQPFEAAVAGYGPPWGEIHEQRDVEVAGNHAALIDFTAGDTSRYPGARFVCYVVDHDGSAFTACTVDQPSRGQLTFKQRRDYLDQFVATLQFQEPTGTVNPGTASPLDCVASGVATITVPDVVGMRLGPAIRAVESAGLNVVGYGTPVETDPVAPAARVQAEKPSGGERVPAGACVGFRTR